MCVETDTYQHSLHAAFLHQVQYQIQLLPLGSAIKRECDQFFQRLFNWRLLLVFQLNSFGHGKPTHTNWFMLGCTHPVVMALTVAMASKPPAAPRQCPIMDCKWNIKSGWAMYQSEVEKKHRRIKYLGCIYFDPRWVLKDFFDGIHLCQITSKGGCGMTIDIVDLQIM